MLEAAEFEGKSAKVVKQALAPKTGVTRLRQRLFLEGDAVEIPDDEVFASAPVKVQLVVLEFCPPDVAEDQEMILAAKDDDTVGLERLLKCPRSPNTRGRHGETPLHHAAECGHVDAMRLLLEAGAEIDTCDEEMAPLHMAALSGHLEAVHFLVQSGAQKDLLDAIGRTPLGFAVFRGHLDIARFLVEEGASKDKLVADANALNRAAEYGNLDMVRFLLEIGCDRDATDDSGGTPLHHAALLGDLDIVRFLVESGANRHLVDKDGRTALDWASECGQVGVVAFLSEPRRKIRRFNNRPRRRR